MTIFNWYVNSYALILILCSLINIWVAFRAWRQRTQVGFGPAVVLLGTTIWTLTYAIATGAHNLPERLMWAKMQYIGIALAAFAMPFVILYYLGWIKQPKLWMLLLSAIVPAAGLALPWTNELHNLLWQQTELVIVDRMALLKLQYGPLFWAFSIYNSAILVFAAFVFLRGMLVSPSVLRQHSTILFIATLFPAVTLLIGLTDLNPIPGLDLMPLGYSLCAWILAWGLVRYNLFTILPVARHTVIENMSDGVFVIDRLNCVIDANPAILKLIDRTPDQVIGQPVSEIFDGQPGIVKQYLDVDSAQVQITLHDGDAERFYELHISPLDGHGKRREGRVVVVREVTEQRRVEEALKQANARMEQTIAELENRNQEMIQLNELDDLMKTSETADAVYEVILSAARRIFPDTSGFLAVPEDASRMMKVVLSWGQSPAKPIFKMDECFALQYKRLHSVDPNHNPDGCGHIQMDKPTASVCVPMLENRSEITGLLHVCLDDPQAGFSSLNIMLIMAVADSIAASLTNLRLREYLRQQSIRDPLTNLFNRRYMEETFAREIMRAERSHYPLGVIMFDIDHFKLVNDHYGHPAGDVVLHDLGQLLLRFIRGGDVACRYGGEEFVLIMPEAGLEEVFQKAEQLRQKVKGQRWSFHGNTSSGISISLGVAAFPLHGKTVAEVLQSVDEALYRAKQAGRDRVML